MGQSFSLIRQSLKGKREPESDDQNEARKVLVVEGANEDVQSNSITRSTSSYSESGWDYEVFLSFRGEDTRKNFTDHLYSALERVGIHTYRDAEGLDRGENISSELLNAIRRSRISIVVFSKGYASSRWCLDELAEIVDCKNTKGHTLLPIFYHVEPSDVRNQTKTFAEAFTSHEKRFQTDIKRVQRWRKALTEAAECSGWDLESLANGYESRFIEEIVEDVLCKVNPSHLDVAKHPIGMKSRVDDIKDLLNLGASDVCIVGIYGMGGIGKTTLAKSVYNEICDVFQGNSFLSNLKERSEKHGLIHLQKQLLKDIFKTNFKIYNVDSGVGIIERRIGGKKVLVVLDDVDDFENLHKLVQKQWFGQGSRIIVTTRDEHLLSQLEVDKKYKVEELNHWESLRLFSWHAFKMYNPKGDYSKLSIEVVNYVGGLPLALVVLGSFLNGRAISEWKSELEKLQRTPHEKIQKILQISFDSLDLYTKDIFLDIACFFVGMDKEYVSKIFDSCNFFPEIGIPILICKSLVTIDFQNELRMHNLIRDMGREIVCNESPKYPGKRSRLWFYKDALNVLHKHTGSETVEGLILNFPEHLETKAFTNMENLRLLQINSVHLTGSYEHLSKELKWLCWHKCPSKFLPQDFHLENLVILDMQDSNLEQVWETNKIFNNLKVLNLSNSKSLTRSPGFSQVPQLEILILEGCTSLVEIHESIGLQTGLVLLNLHGCENLRNLPSSISNLKSLKTLVLSKCFSITKLPEQLGNMTALMELNLDNTAIKQLPSSFQFLSNVETLSLRGCECLIESPEFLRTSHLEKLILEGCTSLVKIHESIGLLNRLDLLDLQRCTNLENLPSIISNLESLTTLNLCGCCKVEELPKQLGNMTALLFLDVGHTAIKQLPSSFNYLPELRILKSEGCTSLQSISLPRMVHTVNANGCTSLERISMLTNSSSSGSFSLYNNQGVNYLYLENCHKLVDIQDLESWQCRPTFVRMGRCNNPSSDFRESVFQIICSLASDVDVHFPGSEIPNWFSYQAMGSSVSFRVPPFMDGKMGKVVLCIVYAVNKEAPDLGRGGSFRWRLRNKSLDGDHSNNWGDWDEVGINISSFDKFEDHIVAQVRSDLLWRRNRKKMKSGDEIEVAVDLLMRGIDGSIDSRFMCGVDPQIMEVKRCGVHLLDDKHEDDYDPIEEFFESEDCIRLLPVLDAP